MPMLLNGDHVAHQIRNELKIQLAARRDAHGYVGPLPPPCLAVVLCTDDPASQVYVKKKIEACEEIGFGSFLVQPFQGGIYRWENPREHLLKTIDWLNSAEGINGILVQLPLPKEIDQTEIFDRIDPLKDVDVFNPVNVGLLLQGRPRFIPCTPHAVQELLTRSGVAIAGKKVVIINRSDIVGKPLKALLIQDDVEANATVTLCHDRTPPEMLKEVCLSADIIVVAVGKPRFLTADMVRVGSIVVDVGINRVDGKIVGDVHPEAFAKVAAISPVPGGVGPMTVTMLMFNTLQAQHLQWEARLGRKVSGFLRREGPCG